MAKQITMLYFSGTGNSRYVAELFSQNLGVACHSIEEAIDFDALIAANDTIGFCYPVYGSRVPKIMREFALRHHELLVGKSLIILCTQMGFSGDGARVFTDIFKPQNVEVLYAEHILMPNNICNLRILPLAQEKLLRKYVSDAQEKVMRICKEIGEGKRRRRGFNPLSRALGLIQGVFMPGLERMAMDRVWIDGSCNECLLCVSLCPRQNIQYEDGELSTKNDCIMCYRCINKCPEKAIAVFMRAKVIKQYEGIDAIVREAE